MPNATKTLQGITKTASREARLAEIEKLSPEEIDDIFALKTPKKAATKKTRNDKGELVLAELPEAEDGSHITFSYDEDKDVFCIRHIGRRTQEVVLDRDEWDALRDVDIPDEDDDEDEDEDEEDED